MEDTLIKAINQYFIKSRNALNIQNKDFLILQKQITSDVNFKVYKTYQYDLWLIRPKSSNDKEILFTHSITVKSSTSKEEEVAQNYVTELTNWLIENNETIKSIVNGTYNRINTK